MTHHNHQEHDFASHQWDDETAEWYADEYGNHISNALTIKNIELRTTDILLDVGSGTGTACREASKFILRGKIIGIDPAPAMIRIARDQTVEEITNVDFMEGCAEDIPCSDDYFTVVTAINSLHHWNDCKKGLAEVKRVLRSSGRFFVSDEIVQDGSCGHGEGPLSNPEKVMNELDRAGFVNVSLKTHADGEEGIYLFRAEKI